MIRIIGAMAIVLLFAGCAANVDDANPRVAGPGDLSAANLANGSGAIEGVVVDTSLAPVANATVRLEESGRDGKSVANVTTNEAGRFAFRSLTPASYRVVAVSPGFADTARILTVDAGATLRIQLTLNDVPSAWPYVDLLIRNGHFPCGSSYVLTSGACDPANPPVLEFENEIPAGHQLFLAEVMWRDSSIAMDLSHQANSVYLGGSVGSPPIQHWLYPATEPFGRDAIDQTPRPVPPSTESYSIVTWGYYDGHYYNEINTYGEPVCSASPLGYCTGVGVDFDFRYTIYTSLFMHELPPGIDTYSAIPDA